MGGGAHQHGRDACRLLRGGRRSRCSCVVEPHHDRRGEHRPSFPSFPLDRSAWGIDLKRVVFETSGIRLGAAQGGVVRELQCCCLVFCWSFRGFEVALTHITQKKRPFLSRACSRSQRGERRSQSRSQNTPLRCARSWERSQITVCDSGALPELSELRSQLGEVERAHYATTLTARV